VVGAARPIVSVAFGAGVITDERLHRAYFIA
jgi:hypothetical protein